MLEFAVVLVVVQIVANVDVRVDLLFVLVHYLFQGVVTLLVAVGNVVKLLFVGLDLVQVFHYFRQVETILVSHFYFLFLNHFHWRNLLFFADLRLVYQLAQIEAFVLFSNYFLKISRYSVILLIYVILHNH